MNIEDLVNILSGSVSYDSSFKSIAYGSDLAGLNHLADALEFPPKEGSIWRFRRYPAQREYANRVLVTGTFTRGLWTTVTVVTEKGVSTGDYMSSEWSDTFELLT